ncbi:putative biopterin transporter family [Plasmopara halstedii]
MDDQHFGELVEDGFPNFRPIRLYDSHVDTINDSLTLSQSRMDPLSDFDTLSSQQLDEIDAEGFAQDLDHMTSDTNSLSSHQDRIFALDDVTFYYRALGSLRSELVPIKLFDRWHLGLAISVVASGFTASILCAGYRPLLLATMNHDFNGKYSHNTALLNWGVIFSVLLGLFSDCVPFCGTRRKAYIVLGWIVSTLSFGSVSAIYVWEFSTHEVSDAIFGRLVEFFSILGSISLQFSWVTALALVVGFGQREAISERGGLASSILIFWQLGALTANIGVAEFQTKLTLLNTSTLILIISVIVLPFVLWFLYEDDEQGSTATLTASTKQLGVVPALHTGILHLWEICQEIVTHRVLLFLLLYGMLLHVHNPNIDETLANWSEFPPSDYVKNPWVLVIMTGGTIFALMYAKLRLLRTAWRHLALYGIGIIVFTAVVQATVIATDTVRTKWFYALSSIFRIWPTSWLLLFTVLTTTEIAHVGCEGVTMGFVLSGQAIGTTVMNGFVGWINYPSILTHEDSHSTRTRILFGTIAYATVNLIAIPFVFLLPSSKLETQQLRAFGGHDKRGAILVVVLFLLFLVLVILANIL